MTFGVKPILGRNGALLGYIATAADASGDQSLLGRNGDLKGRYNAAMDLTMDRNGKMVARGNFLGMLVE